MTYPMYSDMATRGLVSLVINLRRLELLEFNSRDRTAKKRGKQLAARDEIWSKIGNVGKV